MVGIRKPGHIIESLLSIGSELHLRSNILGGILIRFGPLNLLCLDNRHRHATLDHPPRGEGQQRGGLRDIVFRNSVAWVDGGLRITCLAESLGYRLLPLP